MTALHSTRTDPAAYLRALTIRRAALEARHRGLTTCRHSRRCAGKPGHIEHARLCAEIRQAQGEREQGRAA